MVNTGDEETSRGTLEERAKSLFDASVAELGGNIRSQLTRSRHAAIADVEQRSQRSARRGWMPAVGAAAVALTVTAVLFTGITLRRDATPGFDDVALLLDDDDLDLVEEMEFYAWLDNAALSESDRS